MKRKFLSCLMFSALIGAGMISVTSCADYDADFNDINQSIDMTVEQVKNEQIKDMTEDIKKLQEQIDELKSKNCCQCGDIDKRIRDAITEALAGLNYSTPEEVADAIKKAIDALPTGLTEEQVNALINTYHATHKDCECGDIEKLIKEYLQKNKYITASEAEEIAKKYYEENPNSSLDKNAVNSLIETYINNLLLDEGSIKKAIDAAITAALADYVGCTCKPLTEDEIKAIIEQYRKDNPCYTTEDIEQIIENCTIIKNLTEAKDDLEKRVKDLEELTQYTSAELTKTNTAVANAQAKADAAYDKAVDNGITLDKLQFVVNNLKNLYVNLDSRLTTAEQDIANAKQSLEDILIMLLGKDEDGNANTEYDNAKSLLDRIVELENNICSTTNTCNCYENDLNTLKEKFAQAIFNSDAKTKDDFEAALTELKTLLNDVRDLKDRMSKVENKLAHLVTNIELQGSINPAFGYFALPMGVTSNVLIAYYGDNGNGEFEFPTIGALNLVYNDAENWITPEDAARIGLSTNTETIEGGKIVGGTGNAGKLYLTVNPSSVNFDGIKFSLVNSLGEESPVTLGALQHSNDKLTFGYTRGTSNGFYEATATVTEDNLNKASFKVEPELTAALKDVASKKFNANISNLSHAVYEQLNGMLDAYAVQATWTENYIENGVAKTAEHTTTSRYGIAATAVKPLGYKTLYGKSFKLPTVTPLSERNIDLNDYIKIPSFNFDFSSLDVDKFADDFKVKIHFSDVWLEADGSIWTNLTMDQYISSNGSIESAPDHLSVEGKYCLVAADGTFGSHIYDFEGGVNPYDKTTLSDAQKVAINAMIALLVEDRAQVWSAQLQDGFQNQMINKLTDLVKDINKVIEDVSSSLQGNLNGKLQDMIDNANNKLNSLLGKTDPFFKQFNNLMEELNDNFLGNGNPNLRLQSHLFYEDAKGFLHPMSNSKAMPTLVSGSGEAMTLEVSSYTKEILAPAYKKFVAVTNVYKDGKDASDPTLKAALQAANNVPGFNEVIDGDRYEVVFHPTASLAGATYEIVYSSVDYAGNISQRKYYVKVN